jgi:formate dehydrogenase subunit gamma
LLLENDRFTLSAVTEANSQDAAVAAIARGACAAYGNDPSALLEILHDLQQQAGYITQAALPIIADALNRSRAEVYGVASFYHDFRDTPRQGHDVRVCLGEACRSMGSGALFAEAKTALGQGGEAEVSAVYCLGNCALSPAVMIDDTLHGRMTAERLASIVAGTEP